ncbi:MAG: hypothetical protein JXB35_02990 [Anaerolineae bacterium]|nr:hypothetical protein [Anaerolineae bacterium]
MWVLDLKTAIFGLLATLVGFIVLTLWLVRRRAAHFRKEAMFPGGPSLMSIWNDAPVGLLVVEGAALLYVNAYARRLLRLTKAAQSLPDTEWASVLLEDQRTARADAGGAGRFRNITFVSGRTARWWLASRDARDFVFLLDITSQQRAEQAGRALVNDLAHELRTPIATILTHLEILGLPDIGDDLRRQSLTLSRQETQRMVRLVNDMLELGRLETAAEFSRRPVDLRALVEDVVLQATPQASQVKMDLTLDAEATLPLVLGNADRLRQVFLNLLDNAFKYAGPGDRISIALRRADSSGVRCTVCDTGPGIPPEHIPHLARRFYRAAPKGIEGSGLGLALVAEILRRHESLLDIESPVSAGRGTRVTFVLPAVAERAPEL